MVAVLLTLLTMGLAWAATPSGFLDVVGFWGGRLKEGQILGSERGLFKLLAFAMQVALTLVTGHALANAPGVRRVIDAVVGRVRTEKGAIAVTALVSLVAGFVNWGLGLIVGALMAREMGASAERRGLRVHYPLLGAAGYGGLMVWHGGLSATAPLKVTQEAEILDLMPSGGLDPVPLSETLLSPLNLTVAVLCLVGVPILLVLMRPAPENVMTAGHFLGNDDRLEPEAPPSPHPTPAARLERSRILAAVLAALAVIYLVRYLGRIGVDRLDLNAVNLAFLTLGLVAHGSLKRYGDAVADGTRSASGVILQFPFYAGIMGLMDLSGLMAMLAQGVASVATPGTFGIFTFFSAGLVNLFVPSGGGQWAVQGPVVVGAAHELGVPIGKAIMAFCYGDQWTNMLQPFWALPLLGITRLKAGDLIGYTAALMFLSAALFLVPLWLF